MTIAPGRGAGNILVLTLHTGGHYYGEMLAGVLRTAAAAGRHVVVAETREPGERHGDRAWGPAFSLPLGWDQVAGVVSIANSASPEYLAALREQGFPVVLASEVHEGFAGPVALPANRVAIEAAVQHLADHGHRRIGFVGSLDIRDFRERYDAYRVALAGHGLPVDDSLYFPAGDYSRAGGASAAPALLAHPDPPTAVVTATDANAIGLMGVLTSAGVSVPGDLAVLGFDNIEEGAYATPSLSSVGQRFQDVGALAGRLLLDLIAGTDVPAGSYVPETVVMARRASCGCRTDLSVGTTAGQRVAAPGTVHSPVDGLLAAAQSEDERAVLTAVTRRIEDLALSPHQPADDDLAAIASALREVSRDEEDAQSIAADLTEHVIDIVDAATTTETYDPATIIGHGRVAATLWELQARGHRHGERRLDASAIELESIASALLRSDSDHTRSLAWLARTHVRAGVLTLWEGPPADGRLRIAGLHDPEGLTDHRVGDLVDVRQFPSQALTAASRAGAREMCVVLPVSSRSTSWGLLTLLGRVDTSSVREPYHHMTELLYRALEADELEAAVRTSGERYAWAARASNDGLWELDLATGALYLSARCRDLLGLRPHDEVTTEEWLARVHPDDRADVRRTFEVTSRHSARPAQLEYRLVPDDRADSEGPRWLLSRGLGVPGPGGTAVRLVGSLSDVTTRRALERRLRDAAMYDEVTGLPNRRYFLEELSGAVRACQEDPERTFAVIFLDLDGFKLVNDSLGHLAGDDLLRVVAERLRSTTRPTDLAARFGGDEFAVLLTGPAQDDLLEVAGRLQQVITRPVLLGEDEVSITASIGIATSASGYTDPGDVLRDADTAMYRSKAQHGDATVFDPGMHEHVTARLRTRAEIRTALAEHQFVVHYQPIVPLDGAPVTAFEALVRWQHPERGLLLPGRFLPTMEDTNAMVVLGRQVVESVCGQIAAWRDTGLGGAQVSVNVSHLEFWHADLVGSLAEAIERHGLAPSALVLEITESVIMTDIARASHIMAELGRHGFRLHVDDFGTGHSSLQALQTFPVDTLKIDGSFVRDVTVSDRSAVIVRAMVAMAAGLGMDVIAECVEVEEQAQVLRDMGCTSGQGWLYARAVPPEEAGRLLGHRLGARAPDRS